MPWFHNHCQFILSTKLIHNLDTHKTSRHKRGYTDSSSVESQLSKTVCDVFSPLRSLRIVSSPSLAARVSSELRLGFSPKSAISLTRGFTVLGLTMAACSFSQTLRKRRVGPETQTDVVISAKKADK